jgi:hypothetical protein
MPSATGSVPVVVAIRALYRRTSPTPCRRAAICKRAPMVGDLRSGRRVPPPGAGDRWQPTTDEDNRLQEAAIRRIQVPADIVV